MIVEKKNVMLFMVVTLCEFLCLTGLVLADIGYSDSAGFSLNLLTQRGSPTTSYANSSQFAVNLLAIRRASYDSAEFAADTRGAYQSSTVRVTASVKYVDATKNLYITAYAFNCATGAEVTSGTAGYEILDMGRTGTLIYIPGGGWRMTVDLSANPPAGGRHAVTISIGSGSGTCSFNVIVHMGTVTGLISDTEGVYLSGCDVRLYQGNAYFGGSTYIASTTTDGFGRYTFTGLLPGLYIVSVQKSGYVTASAQAKITIAVGAIADVTLSPVAGPMQELVPAMQGLRQKVDAAMTYETGLMSEMSGDAREHLSGDLSWWDVVSLIGDVFGGVGGGLSSGTVTDAASRQLLVDGVVKEAWGKAIKTKLIQLGIHGADLAGRAILLPDDLSSLRRWETSELQALDYYQARLQSLNDSQSSFESEAPTMTVSPDFDPQKAAAAIDTQKNQLSRLVAGEPLVFVAASGSSDGYYVLMEPVGYETWKGNHAMLSITGGTKKVASVVQIAAGTVAIASAPTGVGAVAGGAICVGAGAVKRVVGRIDAPLRVMGALTYGTTTYGWLIDMAQLPLSHSGAVDLLEAEAASPYYLSKTKSFSGDLSVNMNLVPVSVPLPINWNTADVTVANTSSLSADYLVIAHGWWDYKLPGDWPGLGWFFGGETNIKIPTVPSMPRKLSLSSGTGQTFGMTYMGYAIDPVNLFSPHWLKLDLYAGPFLVDSVSKSYYSYNMPLPLNSSTSAQPQATGVYASALTSDGIRTLDQSSYTDMLPVITQLADSSLDAATSFFETSHAVSASSYDVEFKLLAGDGVHIVLQVYDANDDCVGFDHSRDGVVTEFIGTYVGDGTGYQQVIIPNSVGKTFRVRAVLDGSDSAGPFPFQLFAFETPVRPAVMGVSAQSVEKATPWDNVFNIILSVGESGRQLPLQDVSVALSPIVGTEPNSFITVYTATTLNLGIVPAGSSQAVEFELSAPASLPLGDYTGQIVVTSSNAGAITIPVTITLDDARADINGDGVVDFADFALMASVWMQTCSEPGWCAGNDLDQSHLVDFMDMADIAQKWLWQASWHQN